MVKVAGVAEGKEQCVGVSGGHASRTFVRAAREIVGRAVSRLFAIVGGKAKTTPALATLSNVHRASNYGGGVECRLPVSYRGYVK